MPGKTGPKSRATDAVESKLAEITRKLNDGLSLTAVAKEIGVSTSFLSEFLKEKGIIAERGRGALTIGKEAEMAAAAAEFKKMSEIATTFGFMVARRWLPWLDKQMQEQSLDRVVEEVMQWRMEKEVTLARIDTLKAKIAGLEGTVEEKATKIVELAGLAEPNIRFRLKVDAYRALTSEAVDKLFKAKLLGIPIEADINAMAYGMWKDLEAIDKLTPGEVVTLIQGEHNVESKPTT